MTLVYVGVFIMSLSFALVSIFIAKLLLKTSQVASTLSQTATDVEMRTEKAITELEHTLLATEVTTTDIQIKLRATEGLFSAVSEIGNTSQNISEDLLMRTKRFNGAPNLPGTKGFVRTIQATEFGLKLLKSWKRGQKASV